jgi:hypothetical protein
MPQLNKGGKFVFGLSVICPDLTIHIPPQALLEYGATRDGKVIIFTGSKITGGFCITTYSLLSNSKLKHILEDCPVLRDCLLSEGEFMQYKGRKYAWLDIDKNGVIKLPHSTLAVLELQSLFLLRKEENVFDFLGIKTLGKKQISILVVFVVFSVGGQIIPKAVNGEIIPWNLLPLGIIPLIMTTFFEEFLFRGFFQNKFEKEFGSITAILVSGLMFSLYHVGYPRFRTFEDILLLFVVGIGFATAYKLSGNNLIVPNDENERV